MIFNDFSRALSQMSDPRFLRVLGLGVALSVALLLGVYGGFLVLIDWLMPETFSLPWIGEVRWLDDLLSVGSLILMLLFSIFLMVPVAALFCGVFLDDVAGAVEARHYSALGPAPRQPTYTALVEAVNFTGVLIVVNLLALALYFFIGPFAPLLFWALNGYLLGREYFVLVASRRLGRAPAHALRRRHWFKVWWAGMLMAAPLSVPLVNLVIPVLGVATFTHLFHRLNAAAGTAAGRGQTGPQSGV